MLNYGYDPRLSEGAVKSPVFLTSTFVFNSAEEGQDFFDFVAGRKQPSEGKSGGLVCSRFNHPNSEIVEDRLAIYEGAESAALFSSGMSAIATTLLTFARPGEVILHSQPLYGGTETLLSKTLHDLEIKAVGFSDGTDEDKVHEAAKMAWQRGRLAMILIETPANPTNSLVDIRLMQQVADVIAQQQGSRPILACVTPYSTRCFIAHCSTAADISLYSLTKYVGGHSDLITGAALGTKALMNKVCSLRSAIGTQLDPHSNWMIGRSLETLSLRMEKAASNAEQVAAFLRNHSQVEKQHWLLYLDASTPAEETYQRKCNGAGSTFSFDIKGGQPPAVSSTRWRCMQVSS